jgi:excisionase family DNA binding protein
MTTVDQAPLGPGPTPLLSVGGAAEFLGVSDSTIRRLIRSEELRSLRVGVQIRLDQAELERYAAGKAEHAPMPGLPSDEMEVPTWAEERVASWKRALEDLLPDPRQTQVVVIDRRGAKAFSMLCPTGFKWGTNLWHSTALRLQSDDYLTERFAGKEIWVFEEMVQRGRDVEEVRGRLQRLGVQARTVALIRRRSKFIEGRVADPHLYPIEDLDEREYLEAAAFISRLFDYCKPPLDPEHVLVSGALSSEIGAEEVRERLKKAGIVGVVWNRQSIEDSRVAAVTVDRPQFFDTDSLSLPEGLSAIWDGPCKVRIYLSADGRRITLSFITFPRLMADRPSWEALVKSTWERHGLAGEELDFGADGPSDEQLERAYVDVCTDLSLELLRQAVGAGLTGTLEMDEVAGPGRGELTAFFGTTRGPEIFKKIEEALRQGDRPQLQVPPDQTVPLFVDPDRPMSLATDPETAQSCIVSVLPSRHAPLGPGGDPPDTVDGIAYPDLVRRLRPLAEEAISGGLDGLLDGVRAKPVNRVERTDFALSVMRAFIGSEIQDGTYDVRTMRRTQAVAVNALSQWLDRRGKGDETEIHVAKLVVNLVHDWGEGLRPLAIKPYPYKHGYMPGVDSKVPWRSEAPKYFLPELARAGLVDARRGGRSVRYSVSSAFDSKAFTARAELSGHERSQMKSLVRAYALIQESCKVIRRRRPGDPAPTGEFSDPLIVLSSARNERIAYDCALFEIEDWIRIGRRLFEMLNGRAALGEVPKQYRDELHVRVVSFARAAIFLFEKISMYEAVPQLREQMVELFRREEVDAGDILLETMDEEIRLARGYEESEYPVGLLKDTIPVLRNFSSLLRQVLTEFGFEEDTRSEANRTAVLPDGEKVPKDVRFYADELTDAAARPLLGPLVGRAVDMAPAARGDVDAEAEVLDSLGEAFEEIVSTLSGRIRHREGTGRDRSRDERYGDLIEVARRLEAHPGLSGTKTLVAVGDFYNFMEIVGQGAEVLEISDVEVAAELREKMADVAMAAAEEAGVVAHVSSDNCVLAADDADGLLAAVRTVEDALRVALKWERGLAELAYIRFGITSVGQHYFKGLVAALKLGDGSGFKRGTIALTEDVHGRLSTRSREHCNCEEDENGSRVYIYDHDQRREE